MRLHYWRPTPQKNANFPHNLGDLYVSGWLLHGTYIWFRSRSRVRFFITIVIVSACGIGAVNYLEYGFECLFSRWNP